MVLSGQTEVAILSTCALEEAVAAGAIDPQALRVVHEQPPVSAGACKRSTELFPDMMLASLPNAHPDVVRDVTVAVLTAPPDRRGYDWVSNNNRQRVLELMERLQLGPWAYLRDMSPSALVERYKLPLAALAAALLVLAVHVVRVNLLVRRRTRELMRESRRREAAAEALRASRQALANLERAGMVAQLSAMFAHELKQPLTAIVNYLTGIKMLRAQGTFDPVREAFPIDRSLEAAYLAADIVERVRRSAKRQMPVPERANLCSILSCAMQHVGALKSSVAIERRRPDTLVDLRFPGHEHTKIVDGVPEGWKKRLLGDIVEVKYGKDHKSILDGLIPVYGPGGFMRKCRQVIYDGESGLIHRKGSLNNIIYGDESFWIVGIVFYTKMKMPKIEIFLYFFVKSFDMYSMNIGAAVPSMTTNILSAPGHYSTK